jgi:hypothetical protein
MFCGPEQAWRDQTMHAVADRTGLHNIIIQAVHFVDPETGAQHLEQSSWGPIRFGGLVPIPELVQEAIRNAPGQRIQPHDDRRA